MHVTKSEVLRLYKNLILYSRSLTLTDPTYFRRRIAAEFRNKKTLTEAEEIHFAFKNLYGKSVITQEPPPERSIKESIRKERHCFEERRLCKMFVNPACRLRHVVTSRTLAAFKHTIDYTKVPKINECDLSEQFVRGSGPGGSAVNKNANCVVLTHIPTGTVIKCHISRSQDDNRKLAREMLIAKLDEVMNGDDSVEGQKKKLQDKKYKRSEYKKKKMAQLKSEWKKREGLL